jgi:hypothetical protein
VKELSADAARQDSGRATLWFMLAAFSFPLSFGGAGLLGFLLFRD